MKFGDHNMEEGPTSLGIERWRINFQNGYGATVIRGEYTYGGEDGLWELGVWHDGSLCYTTPIGSDVIGHLTEDDVAALLDQITALPVTVKEFTDG